VGGEYGDDMEYQSGQEGKAGGRVHAELVLTLLKKSSSAELNSSVTVGTSLLQ